MPVPTRFGVGSTFHPLPAAVRGWLACAAPAVAIPVKPSSTMTALSSRTARLQHTPARTPLLPRRTRPVRRDSAIASTLHSARAGSAAALTSQRRANSPCHRRSRCGGHYPPQTRPAPGRKSSLLPFSARRTAAWRPAPRRVAVGVGGGGRIARALPTLATAIAVLGESGEGRRPFRPMNSAERRGCRIRYVRGLPGGMVRRRAGRPH